MKGTVFWGNETGLKYGLDVRDVGLSIMAVSSVMHCPPPPQLYSVPFMMNSVISHDFKLGLSFLVANLFSPGGVLLILYLILLMSLFAFSATKWAYEPLDSLSL